MASSNVREAVPQYYKTFRRSVRRYGVHPLGAIRSPDPRWVFVVGSPRSGTSFSAESLGQTPQIVDLGEVPRYKAIVPAAAELAAAGADEAAIARLSAVLKQAARVGMGGGMRCLEQTPESSFVIPQLARAFPEATFVHLTRDGRDVVSSLIERGWLAPTTGTTVVDAAGTAADDAGQPYGEYPRFWVEPGLHQQFAQANEARRCAWAWRRYETACRQALAELPPNRAVHLRYEEVMSRPAELAGELARRLGQPEQAAEFAAAFGAAHPRSIGRYRTVLSAEQVATVEAEAGALLTELGYR